ncbi:MAG TPA: GntR family transcriptional regulator [Caulobacteraceae bacterium]|jgi:DNA-binding GntR family transcriptional regulator
MAETATKKAKGVQALSSPAPIPAEAPPSRLHIELAARILRLMKDQGAGRGHHLVEHELCSTFGVSRTPIRGALRLLEKQGCVEARTNRGYILLEPVTAAPVAEPANPQDEADQHLLISIAAARNAGSLPNDCSVQQICRMFDAKPQTVNRVLRKLADLGLAERKTGNGWTFLPLINSLNAQNESYKFRRAVEPALFLQDTFQLDRAWAKETRRRHTEFRRRPWSDFRAVEFYDMNSDFHEQLARCSGNRYLLDAVRRQIQLRSFLNYQWDYGRARVLASIDEHMQILGALESGNSQLAADHMIAHLTASSLHTRSWPGDSSH